MIYLEIILLCFGLHLLLKLNWLFTGLLLVYFIIMLHFHKQKMKNASRQRERFEMVSVYIDTLLYSFVKEEKIIRAFEDVVSTLKESSMKKTVQHALDYMQQTFDDREIFRESIGIIEKEYNCERVHTVHEFMLHSEYYGGEIEKTADLLLEDKNAWVRRINEAIDERKRYLREIILSAVVSLLICGIIMYLPAMRVDISGNIFVQLISVIVVILDDLMILRGQSYLEADWLTIDMTKGDNYTEKLKNYSNYDEKREKKLSYILAAGPMALTVFFLLTGRQVGIFLAALVTVFMLNQHKIGHRLMKKNLLREIKSAFPKWLMDISLLIQNENVHVAIEKSCENVCPLLREEVNSLLERLNMEPESSKPFHEFLKSFQIPQISSAMGILYAISIGNSGNGEKQIKELISNNFLMLDAADSARLKNKTAGMYLLFLAPVVTASFKLIVDMAVFLLGFLSQGINPLGG